MAGDNSLKGLYLRIGLNFDELNKDFVQAERTLKQNMDHLNNEKTIIRLKTEVDLKNVDSEMQKLKILQESINKQIAIQQTRVQLATAAWKEAVQRTNEHSDSAQKTLITLKSEEIALAKLAERLKEYENRQKALPKADNSLVAGYKGVKSSAKGLYTDSIGALTNKYNELSAAAQTTDGAITKSLEVIGGIPSPVGKAAASILLLPLAFRGLENSIIDMTKAATLAGDSVYVMSRGFQMSVAETFKFTTNCKVAGVEVDDLSSTVKRLQQTVLKAGSSGNAATRMLQRYGVSIYDASGHLKNLNDMTESLSRGLKKAQAEGNGAAFTLSVFRNASGDAITAIEDWEEVNAQAATIVKNGLANPALAHQVKGNLNAMNVQAAQLNAAFSSAFLPVANEIIPRVTARMGDLVRFLAENKDEIKSFGQAVGNFFGKIEDGADVAFSAIGKLVRALKELKISDEQRELERSLSFNLNPNPALYNQTLAYYNPMFKGLAEVKSKTKESIKAIQKEISQNPISLGGVSAVLERSFDDDILDAKIKQVADVLKIERETAQILYSIDHDSYETRKNDLFEWWRGVSTAQNTTDAQREAYEKQYHAKLQALEKEHTKELDKEHQERVKKQEEAANKIKEITRETASIEYGLTHSAFEKQLYDIERWKEAQTEKADTAEEVAAIIKNAAAKEAEAYEREVERIKGATQSLEDEIFEMENSQYEADKRRAMQKAQKALDEGIDPAIVQRYLNDKLGQLAEKASKGGDYVKSPGDKPGAKFIDFDKPTQPSIGLFTDSGKIKERLKTSTEQVKDVQTLLKQSMESNIEVLKGTEGALNDFRKGLESTETSTPQVIGQNVLSSKELQSLVAALARTQLVKDSYGNYSTRSGRGAELYTFIHSLENMGAQWQQISAFLDRLIAVHGQPQQVQQSRSVNNTNNYYNTFNVDGGDDDSVEKIANEIANILERNTQNGRSYAT